MIKSVNQENKICLSEVRPWASCVIPLSLIFSPVKYGITVIVIIYFLYGVC